MGETGERCILGDARTPGEGLRFKPLVLTSPISPQSLEKMNIEQKMSIRILK
jgi:hypothetical protein